MNTKATVTLFLGSGFLTGWIAQCLGQMRSREEGRRAASEDAAGRKRQEGEITSESLKAL